MRHLETVMGIPMSVDIRDAGDHSAAVRAAFDLLAAADRRFSSYRDDSEVSAVNRGRLAPDHYSDELCEVLALGARAQRATHGAFSLRLPGQKLDTDGVVKGWAVQNAADRLSEAGIRDFCFNAGGDIVVRGAPEIGALWTVGVRSPWNAETMLTTLAVTDCAVATSGTYERGNHITDGRTGLIAHELVSATVICADLCTADILATAVCALGVDGVAWAVAHGADAVVAVTPDGRVLQAGTVPFAASREERLGDVLLPTGEVTGDAGRRGIRQQHEPALPPLE
ncbi:FAD:protein FMN transferase [Leifsonia sp. YAF41]|uniref:FAD:protein FMN transferase n=1 Tax=Leifsonia sp. YAF41 TaxID=3233086 RepID=UPI003F9AE59F